MFSGMTFNQSQKHFHGEVRFNFS